MRFPDERFLAAGLAFALSACGGAPIRQAALPDANGPAADYPVVIGSAFTVDGVLYTPADTLNYDEVGAVTIDAAGGTEISGEHRTLPLPSYVEVTSLETGRTILVRLKRRGPMTGGSLIGLSPGAAEQLDIAEGAPVRVRRVNPPEQERALLRGGERAPERMETPKSLVEVLRRKLPSSMAKTPETTDVDLAQTDTDSAVSSEIDTNSLPLPASPPPVQTSAPAQPQTAAQKIETGFVVQAGAFSVRENAEKVAARIHGTINRSGRLYRVRTGPFASRAEAQASLAKVQAHGYSGARIYHLGQ